MPVLTIQDLNIGINTPLVYERGSDPIHHILNLRGTNRLTSTAEEFGMNLNGHALTIQGYDH